QPGRLEPRPPHRHRTAAPPPRRGRARRGRPSRRGPDPRRSHRHRALRHRRPSSQGSCHPMSDPTPELGHGPDDPDYTDPLTADDASPVNDNGGRPTGGASQASRLVALANTRYRLLHGDDGRHYATALDGPAIAYNLRGRDGLRTRLARLYYDINGQTPNGGAL